MRPALSAREIALCLALRSRPRIGFNEARAFCAGNLDFESPERSRLEGRFNEARAFCAGNPAERRPKPPSAKTLQ